MSDLEAAAMLWAHLQVRAPDARIILLASPRPHERARQAAKALAEVAGKAGRLVDIASTRVDVWSLETARQALRAPEGTTVVSAGGILESPNALVAAAVADAVVVVAVEGVTTREELERTRRELERAGAKLVGAFLVGRRSQA